MSRRLAAAVAGLALFARAQAAAAVEPTGKVTRVQGEMAFSLAVVFACLTSQERSQPISGLPPIYRTGLELAHGDDLRLGDKPVAEGRGWTSTLLGSHLRVLEVAPDRCVVIADQLPVEETLRKTLEVTTRLKPPFTPVAQGPGYNPVRLEARRVADGRSVVVHLEGAEPGLPGHWYRFSRLQAEVTGAAAAATP